MVLLGSGCGNVENVEDAAYRVIDTGQRGDLENACSAECLLGLMVKAVVDVVGGGKRLGEPMGGLLCIGQGIGEAAGDQLGGGLRVAFEFGAECA